MPICGVIGCANRPGVAQCSFHRTPKVIVNQGVDTRQLSEERRRLWKAAIRRQDIATEAKWVGCWCVPNISSTVRTR